MIEPQKDLFEQPRHDENKDVAWLENFLKQSGDWVTSRIAISAIGRQATDDNRRYIRELANASKWIISGQRGYKHIDHATAEEVKHFCNWMESQAKRMMERVAGVRSNAHKIFG